MASLLSEPLIVKSLKLFPATEVISWAAPSKFIVEVPLKIPFASLQLPATVWLKPPSINVAVFDSSKFPSISKAAKAILFPALVNFKLL